MRALHSHGIGRSIHEEPSVPQYYDRVGDFGTLSNPVGPYLEFRNTTGAGLASTAG